MNAPKEVGTCRCGRRATYRETMYEFVCDHCRSIDKSRVVWERHEKRLALQKTHKPSQGLGLPVYDMPTRFTTDL